MSKCNILLDTKTRNLMKSIARKDQTYDSFIVELLNLKIQSDSMQISGNVGVNVENSNLAKYSTPSQTASSIKDVAGGEAQSGTDVQLLCDYRKTNVKITNTHEVTKE